MLIRHMKSERQKDRSFEPNTHHTQRTTSQRTRSTTRTNTHKHFLFLILSTGVDTMGFLCPVF